MNFAISSNKCTIESLGKLNEIDERTFSKLEDISFRLPNGWEVNNEAEYQAFVILEDRRGIYRTCKVDLEENLWLIGVPIFFVYPFFSKKMRKAKKEAYRQFCRLRDKINDAYKTPTTYRSHPILENRIIGD